ncbi:MAG: hypothetical protein J6Y37_10910 [Paludibacteraceae bacterium]|nr:hypothetical protein [Paludibacteraceae bacterium]
MRLVTDKGRWALNDNSMIFSKVVWLVDESDVNMYHVIDDNGKEVYRPNQTDIIHP